MELRLRCKCVFGDVPVRYRGRERQQTGRFEGVEWSAYGAVWQGARLGVGGGVVVFCAHV